MPLSPYVERLRAAIGTDLLLLPSISVLPFDPDGRIMLVKPAEQERWATLGGAVDIGESPAEAAIREAREEAGIEIELVRILGAFGGRAYEVEYPNGDRCAYVGIAYEARIAGGTPVPDGNEITDIGWFRTDELAAVDLNGFARSLLADLGLLSR